MPKRTDIKKVLVIGSGPIVIGQAAEFDYDDQNTDFFSVGKNIQSYRAIKTNWRK